MSNVDPLQVDASLVAKLDGLEKEELFFLQRHFLPVQGSITRALLNGKEGQVLPKDHGERRDLETDQQVVKS